jgi:hypothetical protein
MTALLHIVPAVAQAPIYPSVILTLAFAASLDVVRVTRAHVTVTAAPEVLAAVFGSAWRTAPVAPAAWRRVVVGVEP